MHLNDGQLRAHLDGELNESAARHLAACSDCQARLTALEAQTQRVGQRLAFLAPHPNDPALAARPALARFTTRSAVEKEIPVFSQLFSKRFRPAWGLVTVVALVAASLSFAPVRAWAGQFLGLFRVQQITILPVDTTRLSELTGNESLGKQISQLLSDSVTVTKEPGEPQVAANAAEASQMAGFTIRLPGSRSDAPQLTVQDGTAFQFVVDRARAQSLLDESGHSDLQLPASLDGATIKVDIPAGVTAAYGDCPRPANSDGDVNGIYSNGSPGRRMINCVVLAEIPSPTVTTPPDVDLARLAEIGLEFTGMAPDEARAFSQSVDWTSTLVVPIPRNGASYDQVSVDGVTGNLIRRPTDDAPQYALIWVKDGIIYAIGGLGNDSASALEMANSMR